jgi:PAS domain-containing protein
VSRGLEAVLAGRLSGFQHEYPCHSPTARRWFRLYVAPLDGEPGAVVSHIDITARVEIDPDARVEAFRVPES